MLGLVLGHQLEGEAGGGQLGPAGIEVGLVEHLQRALADGPEVRAAVARPEDRQVLARRPRGLERIVERVELRVERGRPPRRRAIQSSS